MNGSYKMGSTAACTAPAILRRGFSCSELEGVVAETDCVVPSLAGLTLTLTTANASTVHAQAMHTQKQANFKRANMVPALATVMPLWYLFSPNLFHTKKGFEDTFGDTFAYFFSFWDKNLKCFPSAQSVTSGHVCHR